MLEWNATSLDGGETAAHYDSQDSGLEIEVLAKRATGRRNGHKHSSRMRAPISGEESDRPISFYSSPDCGQSANRPYPTSALAKQIV
jgi:hypothetical protein